MKLSDEFVRRFKESGRGDPEILGVLQAMGEPAELVEKFDRLAVRSNETLTGERMHILREAGVLILLHLPDVHPDTAEGDTLHMLLRAAWQAGYDAGGADTMRRLAAEAEQLNKPV